MKNLTSDQSDIRDARLAHAAHISRRTKYWSKRKLRACYAQNTNFYKVSSAEIIDMLSDLSEQMLQSSDWDTETLELAEDFCNALENFIEWSNE